MIPSCEVKMCLSPGWGFWGSGSSEDVWACMCSYGLVWREARLTAAAPGTQGQGIWRGQPAASAFMEAASSEALSWFQFWGHAGGLVCSCSHMAATFRNPSPRAQMFPVCPQPRMGIQSKVQIETLWRISVVTTSGEPESTRTMAGKAGNGIFFFHLHSSHLGLCCAIPQSMTSGSRDF